MRKLIFGWLALAVAFAVGHTAALNAWFSDVEVSSGNTFTAGTWAPKPSLSLEPDDADKVVTGDGLVTHSIWVSNDADEPKDIAENVELGVKVVEGDEYVSQVSYDPILGILGDIAPGEAVEFSLDVWLSWGDVSEGEVKLEIKVVGEDNRPEHNIGRRAHFTIIKSG